MFKPAPSTNLTPSEPTLAEALLARGYTYRTPARGLLAEAGAKAIVRMSDGVVVTTLKAHAAWEWVRAFDRRIERNAKSSRCWVCGAVGAPVHERIGGARCIDAGPCEARQPAHLASLHAGSVSR